MVTLSITFIVKTQIYAITLIPLIICMPCPPPHPVPIECPGSAPVGFLSTTRVRVPSASWETDA